MKLIVCLDEALGMAFNNRRQSRDQEVVKKIKEIVGENPLYINEYSRDLFPEGVVGKTCGFYFAEVDLPYSTPDEIYAFYWNRLYPADLKFTVDLSLYDTVKTCEFRGSSHEKITLINYRRKKQ